MRQNSRRSSKSSLRFVFLVGCCCLWALLVILTNRDFLASKDGEDYFFHGSFKSASLQARDANITITQKPYGATSEEEIRSLFDRWNDALLTGNPRAVAELYYDNEKEGSHNAKTMKTRDSQLMLLLPTLSDEPRTNLGSVEDYFVGFLKRKPSGRIVSGHIMMAPDGSWAHDAGIYEFMLQNIPPNKSELDLNREKDNPASNSMEGSDPTTRDKSGTSVVRARYSFFYLRDEGGEWKIAHHHSSLMPERKEQKA